MFKQNTKLFGRYSLKTNLKPLCNRYLLAIKNKSNFLSEKNKTNPTAPICTLRVFWVYFSIKDVAWYLLELLQSGNYNVYSQHII